MSPALTSWKISLIKLVSPRLEGVDAPQNSSGSMSMSRAIMFGYCDSPPKIACRSRRAHVSTRHLVGVDDRLLHLDVGDVVRAQRGERGAEDDPGLRLAGRVGAAIEDQLAVVRHDPTIIHDTVRSLTMPDGAGWRPVARLCSS